MKIQWDLCDASITVPSDLSVLQEHSQYVYDFTLLAGDGKETLPHCLHLHLSPSAASPREVYFPGLINAFWVLLHGARVASTAHPLSLRE